jgi:chromosome segregation ATPase
MELKKELDDTRKELEHVKKSMEDAEALKTKLAMKQTSLEQLQKELISEQARHESTEEDLRVQLAKLEGRLSATETTLVEKKLMVDDLEQRLSKATEEKSTVGSKYETKIVSLQAELESLRNSLAIEQSTLSDKDALISKLEREREEDGAKLERLSSLEKSVSTLQRALSEVETEKGTLSEEITKLKEEREREAQELHSSATRQITMEKDEFAKVLERKDESIKDLTESHVAAIAKLERRLEEEKSSKDSLLAEMDKLKESLETANRISQSRGDDSMHFQERINELEEQIAQQRDSVSRNISESQETVAQLKKQLADAQKAQEEVASSLEALSNEKDEVVDALEQVLNEVQGRDEEIETLTDILEKRDEELEHAKIIATKAIAQAQEIQNKYKEKNSRESSSKADLESKIESLNVSLEFLASKNEDLQKKTARLEAEVREKSVQIARLKEERGSPRDYGPKENQGYTDNQSFASPSTESNSSNGSRRLGASSSRRSRSSPTKSRRKSRNGFAELDSSGNAIFSPFDGDSSDSLSSASRLDKHVAAQSSKDESPLTSKSLGGDFQHSTEWVSDFEVDFDSNSDLNEARSEPGYEQVARQAIERDALRKYVRKRYLKHGESR